MYLLLLIHSLSFDNVIHSSSSKGLSNLVKLDHKDHKDPHSQRKEHDLLSSSFYFTSRDPSQYNFMHFFIGHFKDMIQPF